MNEVDITTSVLLENAMAEYLSLTDAIVKKYGISMDLAEIAMEKALCRIREEKLRLYASALIGANLKKEENQKAEVGSGEQSI